MYAPGSDGLPNESLFKREAPAGDLNSDGYGEYLVSDVTWGAFVNTGIVFILSGEPEILLNDTTLSVEEYPVAGESGGLYLWSNPVVDELHIAWRGDLPQKPSRFVVYDMLGREVVAGSVASWRGSASWHCADVSSGTYLLVALNDNDERIASATLLKRE